MIPFHPNGQPPRSPIWGQPEVAKAQLLLDATVLTDTK